MRVLRCLREFEKWSWLGKMRKNEEKWGKKTASESPFIHYLPISVQYNFHPYSLYAEPHCSVGSVADLRTGGRWFDPRLGQYSIRGLRIVIATGFIPLSPMSVVSTMFMWESSQWLGKNNIVRCTG